MKGERSREGQTVHAHLADLPSRPAFGRSPRPLSRSDAPSSLAFLRSPRLFAPPRPTRDGTPRPPRAQPAPDRTRTAGLDGTSVRNEFGPVHLVDHRPASFRRPPPASDRSIPRGDDNAPTVYDHNAVTIATPHRSRFVFHRLYKAKRSGWV
jgi:hypothetical protein